jgi:hypothetical protein
MKNGKETKENKGKQFVVASRSGDMIMDGKKWRFCGMELDID